MDDKNNPSNMKRNVAVKIAISEIISGEYMKEEGWTPNYVITKKGQVSRVNIIGIVISKDDNTLSSLTIDDGTGSISVRSFENKEILKIPKVGEIILLVGRPREYNGEKYILAEIIKVIEDKRWVGVRRKELEIESPMQVIESRIDNKFNEEPKEVKKEPQIAKKEEMVLQPQFNPYEVVLGLIRSLDTGFGVSYEEVILNSKLNNCEDVIQTLIEEGEIFEIRPGILKVL